MYRVPGLYQTLAVPDVLDVPSVQVHSIVQAIQALVANMTFGADLSPL